MQGSFEAAKKKEGGLQAPWEQLTKPGYDKETQAAMKRHAEADAVYGLLPEERKKFRPKVVQYPELPDKVFPGTPFYRLPGKVRPYVFVVDEPEWDDGAPRVQEKGRWIVPHFIYRDPKEVAIKKNEYKKAYKNAVEDGEKVIDKTIFNVKAEDNSNTDAPTIIDPLFNDTNVTPYPYNQPNFPRKPQINYPATVEKADENDIDYPTPTNLGKEGVDYVKVSNANFEVGRDWLRGVCEQAEEADYAFALSMQGMRGCSLSSVWVCLDPAYDITDRALLLNQFIKMYMEKFYSHTRVDGEDSDVAGVVEEAFRLHQEFCKGWIMTHHRTLAAEITAPSEALVGMFLEDLPGSLTRNQISRYLRRDQHFCGEFAHCLYHYMTSLEQTRGNRNPSYKAMNSERALQETAVRAMAKMLSENIGVLKKGLEASNIDKIFDSNLIDWHYIVSHLPHHHKEFDSYVKSFAGFRTGKGGIPPWQKMRMEK